MFVPQPNTMAYSKSSQKRIDQIAHRIKQLRLKAGYKSAETFAVKNKLARVHYWRMEKGKTNITINTLANVLRVHKLSFEDFFKGID